MSADLRLDLLAHLVVAALLGGVVGWEREASGKPAGLRTNILICVGSALLTDLSLVLGASYGGEVPADPTRIAAQIVTGMGFLGAGTIIQARGAVHGLTTAATLWVVAAIGMSVGAGHHLEAVVGTALVVGILLPLGHLERWVERRRRSRRVIVEVDRDEGAVTPLIAEMEERGLRVRSKHFELRDGLLSATLDVTGSADQFDAAREFLVTHPDVQGVRMV
jgi:putative Mg2+ transporter-C (MgtC) family protein